jgi:hypothetical protein
MRKQKGGFEPIFRRLTDKDFKYTTEKHRIEWTKTLYPFSPYFLQIVKDIPWSDYHFNGPNQFQKETETIRGETRIENIILDCHSIGNNYWKVFGGSVYELINPKLKKTLGINLSDFTDPTGDLDIQVILPCLEPNSPFVGDLSYKYLFEESEGIFRMTNLGEHFSRWIFEHYVRELRKIEPNIIEIFPNSKPFDFREDSEAERADLAERIGNLWVVRTHSDSFIKVQVVMKIEVEGEGDYISHLLEFVLSISDVNIINNNKCVAKHYEEFNFSGLPTQTYTELIRGNLSSYKTRIVLHRGPLAYKLYNHSKRMLYLNEILKEGFRIIYTLKGEGRLTPAIKTEINRILIEKIGINYDEFMKFFENFIIFFKDLFKDFERKTIEPWDRLLIGLDSNIPVREILEPFRNELIEIKYGTKKSKLGEFFREYFEALGFLP